MTDPENLLAVEGAEQARISPAMGVAMIALNMALKYHDISTVQDGTLYQQFKMEGKNMDTLHLDHVFETARRIERHLLTSANQVSQMMIDGVMDAIEAIAAEESPQ
jgi:hypothetical protein